VFEIFCNGWNPRKFRAENFENGNNKNDSATQKKPWISTFLSKKFAKWGVTLTNHWINTVNLTYTRSYPYIYLSVLLFTYLYYSQVRVRIRRRQTQRPQRVSYFYRILLTLIYSCLRSIWASNSNRSCWRLNYGQLTLAEHDYTWSLDRERRRSAAWLSLIHNFCSFSHLRLYPVKFSQSKMVNLWWNRDISSANYQQ